MSLEDEKKKEEWNKFYFFIGLSKRLLFFFSVRVFFCPFLEQLTIHTKKNYPFSQHILCIGSLFFFFFCFLVLHAKVVNKVNKRFERKEMILFLG